MIRSIQFVGREAWQPLRCDEATEDRAANLRLFRLVTEVLHAIEAGVFHPNPGWQCNDCPFWRECWVVG